jgi:L-amino acid N-acyltransferase YncA
MILARRQLLTIKSSLYKAHTHSTIVVRDMSSATPKPKVILRDALLGDMPSVARIYNYYVVLPGNMATFDEEELPVATLEKRYTGVKDAGLPYIVACLEQEDKTPGEVVGYAYARSYGERRSYQNSVEESIYISHDHLRMGVGKLLMMDLLARLRAIGKKQVVAILGTAEDNPGSYKLHADCGFKRVAYFPKIGYKHNRWVDRLHMQVSLDPEVGGIDDHVF